MLYITHDLFVIGQICNEVAVMYASQYRRTYQHHRALPETFTSLYPGVDEIHSQAEGEKKKFLDPIKGMVCSLLDPPPGCKFHPRCNEVMEICSREEPGLKEVAPGHWVSCHLFF